MFDVQTALRALVDRGGSDLHLKVSTPPLFRINGVLGSYPDDPQLSEADTERTLHELLHDPTKLQEFADEHEVDFSFEIPEVARYRVNAFRQRGLISLACRAIPHKIS
ncbi:MAG: type IV pili twitching motility protein PilT, partial [Solirubrobacteraceae bacterium]